MCEELISIIVPVYNVEKYLDRCLTSIVNQTYQNLEIILVDDGSTDDSGKKCDEWAEKDKRIKVIHKENGGLSDARNVGIKQATGILIGFVDSDDYIDEKMYEILAEDLKKYDADIAICNVQEVDENGTCLSSFVKNKKEDMRVLEKEEALYLLVEDAIIQSFAWNKLYKIELFEGIEYPKGKKLEDRATTYRLFDKAKKVVDDKRKTYDYVQRNGSIMHNLNRSLILDELEAIQERQEYLGSHYPELEEILIINRLHCISNLFRNFYGSKMEDKVVEERLKEEYKYYQKYYQIYGKSARKSLRKTMRMNKAVRLQFEGRLLDLNRKIFQLYSHLFYAVKKFRNKFFRKSK